MHEQIFVGRKRELEDLERYFDESTMPRLDLLSRLIDKSLVAVSNWMQGDHLR